MKRGLGDGIKKYVSSSRFILTAILLIAAFLSGWGISYYATPYTPPQAKMAFFEPEQKEATRAIVRAEVVSYSEVKILDGTHSGQIVQLNNKSQLKAHPGDTILMSQDKEDFNRYSTFAAWRFPGLVMLGLILVTAVVLVGGLRGFMSLGGLLFSVAVIGVYVIPMILSGADAFITCITAAYIIAFVSLFVAHGFTFRTFVSVVSVFIVLSFVALLSILGAQIGQLTGVYDETSSILAANNLGIDMYGVLLGGIVIATLGILDDVVTTQVASVDEIQKANAKLGVQQLFKRGYSIGNEHIAALINTLALAYIGVSLPIVLSIASSLDAFNSPYLILNMEYIAQEIVRTLISSLGLVVAVPISTVIAAFMIHNKRKIIGIIKRTNNGGIS
jgi:uncharacterized membrane protein